MNLAESWEEGESKVCSRILILFLSTWMRFVHSVLIALKDSKNDQKDMGVGRAYLILGFRAMSFGILLVLHP